MTASTITWSELVHKSQMSGELAVVLPTASAPLAGLFKVNPQFEIPFALALFNADPAVRVRAIAAALICSRADTGLDT